MSTSTHVDPAHMVYVIDDDASIRLALEDLFASVGLPVLSFPSVSSFLAAQLSDVPACLALDVRMPGQSGLDFQQQMGGLGLDIPVVLMTGHGDIPMAVQAMKNGAIEFLSKPFRDQDLLDAIQRGLTLNAQQRQQRAERQALLQRWSLLNEGEQAVARLVVQGLLNKQVAAQLGVSEITVKVRRAQAMRKMQTHSLAQLVRVMDQVLDAE